MADHSGRAGSDCAIGVGQILSHVESVAQRRGLSKQLDQNIDRQLDVRDPADGGGGCVQGQDCAVRCGWVVVAGDIFHAGAYDLCGERAVPHTGDADDRDIICHRDRVAGAKITDAPQAFITG